MLRRRVRVTSPALLPMVHVQLCLSCADLWMFGSGEVAVLLCLNL